MTCHNIIHQKECDNPRHLKPRLQAKQTEREQNTRRMSRFVLLILPMVCKSRLFHCKALGRGWCRLSPVNPEQNHYPWKQGAAIPASPMWHCIREIPHLEKEFCFSSRQKRPPEQAPLRAKILLRSSCDQLFIVWAHGVCQGHTFPFQQILIDAAAPKETKSHQQSQCWGVTSTYECPNKTNRYKSRLGQAML